MAEKPYKIKILGHRVDRNIIDPIRRTEATKISLKPRWVAQDSMTTVCFGSNNASLLKHL